MILYRKKGLEINQKYNERKNEIGSELCYHNKIQMGFCLGFCSTIDQDTHCQSPDFSRLMQFNSTLSNIATLLGERISPNRSVPKVYVISPTRLCARDTQPKTRPFIPKNDKLLEEASRLGSGRKLKRPKTDSTHPNCCCIP